MMEKIPKVGKLPPGVYTVFLLLEENIMSKLVLFFHSPAGGIYDPMKEKGFDIRFSSNNRVTPWVTSGLSLSP